MLRNLLSIVLIVVAVHSAAAGERYFPKGTLSQNFEVSEMKERWYSKQLRAMNERPWSGGARELHGYRLTWLRTFHHPIVVRLDIAPDGTANLHVKVASGRGGYDPGVLTVNKTIHISKVQTDTILTGLEQTRFWTMASYVDRYGFDGARWIVEGVDDARYHVVDRLSPEGSPFQFWALSLMKLSDVDLEPIY